MNNNLFANFQENSTQIVGSIQTIKNISDMCFISSSRQLLVSNDSGNVLFVNSQNAASFCKYNSL